MEEIKKAVQPLIRTNPEEGSEVWIELKGLTNEER